MNKEQLHEAKEIAVNSAREIGRTLLGAYGKIEHEIKPDVHNNVLTHMDTMAETFLRDRLRAFNPQIPFRGEELGGERAATTWLVDPIDGTAHFVRGIPFCTTMIALIEDHQVTMSVIHDFVRDETYWAIRGEGAYLNEAPIHVSDRPLEQGVVSAETDLGRPGNLDRFARLTEQTRVISTMSGGYEFALVATGRIEGRIAHDPFGSDYDYAAGSLLVEEAGGRVANIGRTGYDYRLTSHIAANAIAFAQLTGPDGLYPVTGN